MALAMALALAMAMAMARASCKGGVGMADITMCLNENCKKKETCFRYKAKPSRMQSYFKPEIKKGVCKEYWKIKEA